MCELLGMSFNRVTNPSFSFLGLLAHSSKHKDGWGIGCYPDRSRSAMVFKEPITGEQSQLAEFLVNYNEFRSKIFIGHIRKATTGTISYDNTHPFSRFYGRREWLFAHNGTFEKTRVFPVRHPFILPAGETDSEFAFCQLINGLHHAHIFAPSVPGEISGYYEEDFEMIHRILIKLNMNSEGSFNCIFSDGEYLFCYRDIEGARKLFFMRRRYPFGDVALRDEDVSIDLNSEKGTFDRGYVIASAALSDEEWIPFKKGQLIVFRNGEVVANQQAGLNAKTRARLLDLNRENI